MYFFLRSLNVRTCWHCWSLSLTCKINFEFILSVVFNEKCKQAGSFCNVLEQDLLLTVIEHQGFTLLVNHKYFLMRLCHFQWNLLLMMKVDYSWTLLTLTINLIFTHDDYLKKNSIQRGFSPVCICQLCWQLTFRATELSIPKLVQRTKNRRMSFSSKLKHQELKLAHSGVL